jgi:CheY-like chemotaxis protein
MKILVADDDADDRVLAKIAFSELKTNHAVEFVNDGEELMAYLHRKAKKKEPFPDLLILDLNMPRKDGRTALREIKDDESLKDLDVIIFSTSNSEVDKSYCLDLGARDYAVKPSEYTELVSFFRNVCGEAV